MSQTRRTHVAAWISIFFQQSNNYADLLLGRQWIRKGQLSPPSSTSIRVMRSQREIESFQVAVPSREVHSISKETPKLKAAVVESSSPIRIVEAAEQTRHGIWLGRLLPLCSSRQKAALGTRRGRRHTNVALHVMSGGGDVVSRRNSTLTQSSTRQIFQEIARSFCSGPALASRAQDVPRSSQTIQHRVHAHLVCDLRDRGGAIQQAEGMQDDCVAGTPIVSEHSFGVKFIE